MHQIIVVSMVLLSLSYGVHSTFAFSLKVDFGGLGQPVKPGWQEFTGNHNNEIDPKTEVYLVDTLSISVAVQTGVANDSGYRLYGGGDLGGDMVYPDNNNGPVNGRVILTLGNLPTGNYSLVSYHNDTSSSHAVQDPFDVTVSGAVTDSTSDLGVVATKSPTDDNLAASTVFFTSQGTGEVVVTYTPTTNNGTVSKALLNGFELDLVGYVPPSVGFDSDASSGFETIGSASIPVVLSEQTPNSVSIDYAVSGGTAAAGTDFVLSPGTLIFGPNQTAPEYIDITIINDGAPEDDETIEVTLSNPVEALLGTHSLHTYTIIDPRPYVEFPETVSQDREDVGNALIAVSLSWPYSDTVTVDYNVTGGTAEGNGTDYTLDAGTLQFDPCDLTEHFAIDLVEDGIQEDPDETVEITLSAPSNSRLGPNTVHTFTILPGLASLCPDGDLDGDCDVDYNDVRFFAGQWLDPSGGCSGFDCADFDGLNGVQMHDFAVLAADWRQSIFPVVINELMASNGQTLWDPCEPDETPDWIELYNASAVAVDMGGMYLTDNLANPIKWQIPDGVTVGAGEYLIFYADEDPEDGPTHADFKLSASGEEIGLFDIDGNTPLDIVVFGEQTTDVSYGPYPDAGEHLRFFAEPTPGWQNSGAYLGEVADTQFSHDRGFYESSFDLSITCDTPDANIYYTLDGSEPNLTNGTLYTGPINDINQTTALRAAAFKNGYLPSTIDTQTYIFLDDVMTQPTMDPCTVLSHGTAAVADALKSIPTLSITLDADDYTVLSSNDFVKPEFPTSVELIYPDANGGEGFAINCGISLHSKLAGKLSYRLEFKSELGAARLDYTFFESAPVNSETAVDRFDRIVLRAASNMPMTYVGDPWARDSQIAMCGIGSHNNFMHLYINGQYEGIYNPVERQDAWFTSAYFGGDFEDYLGTNHGLERCYECGGTCPVAPNSPCHLSGDNTRFDQMMAMAYEADLEDPTKYAQFTTLCDVAEYADYTILFWESGFGDNMDNNWYAGMRNEPPGGFMMFMWDAEYVFLNAGGPPGNEDPWVPYYYFNSGRMISDIWRALIDNEDFQMLFADRVYKHCFNSGALSDNEAQARWDALTDYISEAAIGEVARWGNKLGGRSPSLPPVTVDMNGHVDIFINALRTWSDPSWPNVKLYPDIDPPTFNQHGGAVTSPFVAILTNPNGSGTVYYTLDGTDPRQAVTGNPIGTPGTAIVLTESAHVKARVFDSPDWTAVNEVTFVVGPVAQNVRITEIMYNPADPNTEYIELKNLGPETINLNLVEFTNGIDFTFPSVSLTVGEHVLVVKDQIAFEAKYGTGRNIAGQYSGSLSNGGERIELVDPIGQVIHNFRYSDGWRGVTDGEGFSLTIIDPTNSDANSWDEKDSWRPSAYVGGSPDWDDSGILPDPGAIVINEIMSHSHDLPDWIELYNTTGSPIDVGGWFISDNDSNLTKYEIAAGTTIPGNSYILFYEDVNFTDTNDPGTHVPFAFSENGEQICLTSGYDANGFLTGYRQNEDFGASESNVSFGRYYKASTNNYNFVAMDYNTPGTANAYPKVGPIVINEIMYHPDWPTSSPYGNDQYEYIELYNISGSDVNLYDEDSIPWKFTDGIDFEFPPEANVPSGGRVLVVKDRDAFAWRYGSPPAGVQIFGPYDGRLSNSGEKLDLSMPGDVDEFAVRYYIRVDRVNYSDGSHPDDVPGGIDLWPSEPDGAGKSLSRISVLAYGNDPNNWTAETPSPGTAP